MVRWTAIWSLVLASTALAQASYTNPRYGYRIDVPPGFNLSQESDNGDGRTYIAAEGRASLAVWANYLSGSDFETEMAERIADRTRDGWTVTYRRTTAGWVSFSGTRGDRIFYHRAILLCRDAAAHFLIEYPQSISRQMNAFVGPLVESLKPAAGCVASPESAPNAN